MPTNRLEAFSDGVLAIIITIMVLELHVPEGHSLTALWSAVGTSLPTYALSFVNVGIYWNNHHHMFNMTRRVNGAVLWANLHLLFWLSLIPFTTAWMDGSGFASTPVAMYGIDLLAAAIAYYILQSTIVHLQGPDSALQHAIGNDIKGKFSPVLYVAGITCALVSNGHARIWVYAGVAFFVVIAVMWLIPDRRIERQMRPGHDAS